MMIAMFMNRPWNTEYMSIVISAYSKAKIVKVQARCILSQAQDLIINNFSVIERTKHRDY